MDKTINWAFYRSFLWAMNEGSLSAAARASGATQPTIGRHIAALEKALNLTLFIRSQGGLVPTPSAQALKPFAEMMANTASLIERTATRQHDGIEGTVRITASDVIGVEVLPPILAKLRAEYPGLNIELLLSDRLADLMHHEADIAIRMTRPTQLPLIARSVGVIAVNLFASEHYAQQTGLPDTIEALQHHTLIGYDRPSAFIRDAMAKHPILNALNFSLKADSNLAQLALIRAGAGIGFCQKPLAEKYPTLLSVLPEAFTLSMDTWVTMHEDLRDNPACKIVFHSLAESMMQYVQGRMALK